MIAECRLQIADCDLQWFLADEEVATPGTAAASFTERTVLDEINPQVSARMSSCFKSWRMLEPGRREKAKSVLERIAAHEPLSRDLGEMIARTLKG